MKSFLLFPAMLGLLAGVPGFTSAQATAQAVPPVPGVLGQVKSVTHDSIESRTKTGVVSLDITQPSGLTVEHEAPLRLLAPVNLGLKNVKAITRITYTRDEPKDYWAVRGYSRYDGI